MFIMLLLRLFFLMRDNQHFYHDVSTLCISHVGFAQLFKSQIRIFHKFWKIHRHDLFKYCFCFILSFHSRTPITHFMLSFMYYSVFSITFSFFASNWKFSIVVIHLFTNLLVFTVCFASLPLSLLFLLCLSSLKILSLT